MPFYIYYYSGIEGEMSKTRAKGKIYKTSINTLQKDVKSKNASPDLVGCLRIA